MSSAGLGTRVLSARQIFRPLSRRNAGLIRRTYAQGPVNDPDPPPTPPPTPKPQPQESAQFARANSRHQVQEGSAALSIPFNPPGGVSGGVGGTPSFEFTKNPMFDAALTTLMGLGIGAPHYY